MISSAFQDLHDAFVPIYDDPSPPWYKDENPPACFRFDDEYDEEKTLVCDGQCCGVIGLEYNGCRYRKQLFSTDVSKDEPGNITIPEGAWFRWYFARQKKTGWAKCLEARTFQVNGGWVALELLYLGEDDTVNWALHSFSEIRWG